MVATLVDTTNIYQPLSPCPLPTSDLKARDCSIRLRHMQRLLCLANHVTLLAHYHIGGLLRHTLDGVQHTTAMRSW